MLLIFINACSKPINEKQFNEIEEGMSIGEVESILGIPANIEEGHNGVSSETWHYDTVTRKYFRTEGGKMKNRREVKISFKFDRVTDIYRQEIKQIKYQGFVLITFLLILQQFQYFPLFYPENF